MIGFLSYFVLYAAVAGILLPKVAFAYIDPSTGSFFLQMLIAAIFGASLGIKIFWRKLLSIFKTIFRMKKDENDKKIDLGPGQDKK